MLSDELETMQKKAESAFLMYTKTEATKLQNEMRKNAPWKNRTGDARKTLTGEGYKEGNNYVIKLSYGVNYGIFLELAMEKRYAIIQPTIKAKSQEVFEAFSHLLDNL